jgi:hypothetical protein
MGKRILGTVIRSFFAPGYSTIMLSYYRGKLSLDFYPYTGKDDKGLDHYDYGSDITTTLNYETASGLYQAAMYIITDRYMEEEVKAVFKCKKAVITFECKSDPETRLAAYLTVEENDQSIPFRFKTHLAQVEENGHIHTRVMQSGLIAFTKAIEGYLISMGYDPDLSQLPDNVENSPDEDQQVSDTMRMAVINKRIK